MACAKPSDCAPCSKCPDSPAPVMPRCDVVLADGSYSNATVVVEDGCIISVTQGVPLVYQPDNNCAGTGGTGGGGDSLPGDQGIPGEAATIQIGSVTSLAFGAQPTVENVGTPTHAILNIGIPRGDDGNDATLPSNGADSNAAGINLVNGMITEPLPPAWPPILDIIPQPVIGTGASLTFVKGADGIMAVELDISGLITWFNNEIDSLQATINNHEARIAALEPTPP